ncbi:uncharacterized protein LOC114308220 isoform X2 [Camellia sinensis]|uniref:uncharacterized protein LOC114308220 isoform X2 n=1 Tax=Camellia sinensis TaxID=4442 RepID=UPI001035757B|nr:uncharacterized protein LOC114308220 isoform X2 [Camellia sinensis]
MGQQRKDSFQVKAHPVFGAGKKAKDPIFGLAMGGGSQTSDDNFRWFCIESGSVDNPPIVLIHGFPSQEYSYRKVLPVLSKDYHAIGFDWLERETKRETNKEGEQELSAPRTKMK